jgi:invasion protein IalB
MNHRATGAAAIFSAGASRRAALAALALSAVALAAPAAAQNYDRVGAQQAWSVYQRGEGAGRECWIASTPTRWTARRGGQTVQVSRGDIFLNVSIRPGENVRGEVSMITGYTYREGEPVRVEIGDDRFALVSREGFAWSENAEADARLIEAMKRGVDATVTGVSNRGTTTIDTFSLLGFTAALTDAERLCQ